MTNPFARLSDLGLLALRVAVATSFLVHGTQKWGLWSAAPDGMSPATVNLFKFLSIVEPVGGVAILVGFLTSWAALGLAIIMAGAIWWKISGGAGFSGGWELDFALLSANIALMAKGAGNWAVDAFLGNRKA